MTCIEALKMKIFWRDEIQAELNGLESQTSTFALPWERVQLFFFGFVCFENVIKCQCLGERKEQDV